MRGAPLADPSTMRPQMVLKNGKWCVSYEVGPEPANEQQVIQMLMEGRITDVLNLVEAQGNQKQLEQVMKAIEIFFRRYGSGKDGVCIENLLTGLNADDRRLMNRLRIAMNIRSGNPSGPCKAKTPFDLISGCGTRRRSSKRKSKSKRSRSRSRSRKLKKCSKGKRRSRITNRCYTPAY
jgi:hypothetical protein